MYGSPEVYCVTSVWLSTPKEAASMVLSARLGYKSNTPQLSSTLQLAQPQLAGAGDKRRGDGWTREKMKGDKENGKEKKMRI